jgi:hypothetical protein
MNKMIKLTAWAGGGAVYINPATESLKDIVDIPADDKNSARTRVTTLSMVYLVTESAESISKIFGFEEIK